MLTMLLYNLVAFSTFTRLYKHHQLSDSRTFHHHKRKSYTHLAVTAHLAFLQALASTNLLSVAMYLPLLDTSYKWNHVIGCLLFWILPLSILFSKFILVCSMYQCFNPFYGWIILYCMDTSHFYLSIHKLMDIWVASIFWLLWIMLLWTFVLCEHKFYVNICFQLSPTS